MSWMITYHGRRVDIPAPKGGQVYIDDIAVHLSRIPRFAGATQQPWSVAAHSLHCASLAERQGLPAQAQLYALLHDAHEAFCSDIPSPFKAVAGPAMTVAEETLQLAVLHQLGLRDYMRWNYQIKAIDLISLATERRDLMHPNASAVPWDWLRGHEPDGRPLPATTQMGWADWASDFEERYHKLFHAMQTTTNP